MTITSISDDWFPWKIPSFPVVTINFKNVKFTLSNGKHCNGVVHKDIDIEPGEFCCTSHCMIKIDNNDVIVLWTLIPSKNNVKLSKSDAKEEKEPSLDEENCNEEHTLPFKVMGTCYSISRQDALEEAYEYLYKYNRPVFVKLVEEPENLHDRNAVAVYLMASEDYNKVGYIARELTTYVKPILKTLDVSVKHIRFSTTFSTMGFYLAIGITKKGKWHENVVAASKKVK